MRFEGRHHLALKRVPLRLPLWAVFVSTLLLYLPIEDPRKPPLAFKVTLSLPVLAAVIYLAVILANDFGAGRAKLLPRQSRCMVLAIVAVGAAMVLTRTLYLTLNTSTRGNEIRTEQAQRIILGSVFWACRFFGLDMVGFIIGFTLFWSFFFFGCFGCCCFNCCGRARLVQHLTRRRREAMPFMDMVQNRSQLHHFNPLLFLYPFCIISSCVIGGTLLMEPARTFVPGGPPSQLLPLCSPVVSRHLHARVAQLIERVGIPFVPGSKQQGERSSPTPTGNRRA